MMKSVLILQVVTSVVSAAFLDLDDWNPKPDPVVKDDTHHITSWLGQVPMYEAISKREIKSLSQVLKELAEKQKGLKDWQINPDKYLKSKRSDPIWWQKLLEKQQNKPASTILKDSIIKMSKRIVAFDNGLQSKSWTQTLWDSLFGSDDKVTGFGTPSIGGLGPMVLSKRCMTIKKPDSWYMKVFGYVPKDAGKQQLDANGLPKTRCG